MRSHRAFLAAYLLPQWRRVLVLAGLLFASIGLQLANPQVLRAFIDAATGETPLGLLTRLALAFIGIALVQQACAVATVFVGEQVGWRATNELRVDLMLHVLRLDLGFHRQRTPGELIERIDGDVTTLSTFFSQFVVRIVGSVLLLIGVLVLLWREDWRAGLPITLFALVALAVMTRLRTVAIPYWREFRQSSAELFGFLEERLAGTEDIRSSGAPSYVMGRLYQHARDRLRSAARARLRSAIPWSAPIGFSALGTSVAFLIAARLYLEAAITFGTAFLIYFYARLVVEPLERITHEVEELQRASAGLARVSELMALRSALEDGPGVPTPDGPLSVEFEHVEFGYGEEDMVVHDLCFRLAPGTALGLLGRTGSGKTTVARLLFRLYDPAGGVVRVGGVDLRQARRSELRERVGMVTQDVQLFRATVRQNLTFFDDAVSDERIMAALGELGLADWARALPEGLDTQIGHGATGLSAGEAQLLAFARVFLRDPGLVILDEASSRLDPASERLLERAVDRLTLGRTCIVIAHRLETLERTDEVMILDGGRVVEHGRRAALAGDPDSRFARLLRTGIAEVLA